MEEEKSTISIKSKRKAISESSEDESSEDSDQTETDEESQVEDETMSQEETQSEDDDENQEYEEDDDEVNQSQCTEIIETTVSTSRCNSTSNKTIDLNTPGTCKKKQKTSIAKAKSTSKKPNTYRLLRKDKLNKTESNILNKTTSKQIAHDQEKSQMELPEDKELREMSNDDLIILLRQIKFKMDQSKRDFSKYESELRHELVEKWSKRVEESENYYQDEIQKQRQKVEEIYLQRIDLLEKVWKGQTNEEMKKLRNENQIKINEVLTSKNDLKKIIEENEHSINKLNIDLDEAKEIYKQPKVRRRGVAKPPLKDLGVDPETKKPIVIKDGRFGMYVTDGDTNATLRRGDTVEAMTIERALELLAGRRAWEVANESEGAPKRTRGAKTKGKKKTAPTLTEKTIKDAGSKRKAKKSASGKSKKTK